MIRYGAAIGSAFKSLFKCWALWGFIAVGYLLMGVIAALFFGAFVLSGAVNELLSYGDPSVQALSIFLGGMALLGVIEMLIYYAIHGGSIYLSNKALAGEKVRFADGFSVGIARWPAVTGFELLLGLVIGGLYLVASVIFIAAMGGLLTGSESMEETFIAVFGVLFCAYGAIMLLSLLVGAIVMGFEAVGSRSAVLSGRGGVEAFGDAWRTVKTRLKNVFLMGLAVFGLSWVYSMAASIILTPIQFAFMPQMMQLDQTITPDPVEMMSMMGGMYVTIMTASIVLQFPMMVFLYLVWTAFYRQLVGLDEPAPVPAPQYGYTPVAPDDVPAAPMPPAPPAPPSPVGLPEPPVPGPVPPPPAPPGSDAPTDMGE